MKFHARRLELPHELMIVCRDDDGRAEAIEFDEETQETAGHLRVDVAGRLVGEKDLRFADDGTRYCGALLFAAGKYGRIRVHPVAEPHPLQEVCHIFPVIIDALADDAQRSHVVR